MENLKSTPSEENHNGNNNHPALTKNRYWDLNDLLTLKADDRVYQEHGVDESIKTRLLEDVQANILKACSHTYTLFCFLKFKPQANKTAILNWIKNVPLTSASDQEKSKDQEAITLSLSYEGYQFFCDPQKIGYLIPLKDDDIVAFGEGLSVRCPKAFGTDYRKNDLEKNYQEPSHALILIASNDDQLNTINNMLNIKNKQMELEHFFRARTSTGKYPFDTDFADIFFEIGLRNPEGSDGHSREWFGFRDGLSNPRFFPSPEWQNKPGADPPSALNTVLRRNTLSPKPYACGSFVVFLKLRQNKKAFNRMVKEFARQLGLKDYPGYAAAQIMGRHKDGTPLHPDFQFPASDDTYLNDFDFKNDAEGEVCPLHAHIRKANPRDGREEKRIVRRGKIYGSSNSSDRGILFLSYQSSLITFEDLVNRGLYGYNYQNKVVGKDALFTEEGEYQGRRMYRKTFGKSRAVSLSSDEKLVTFLGGQYFFASSISFIRVNLENCM